MVMINQFDLIGDTDIDDPLQIALRQIEILSKKAAAAAAAAKAAADAKAEAAKAAEAAEADPAAAAAEADLEFPVEEAQKGVLALPEGDLLPYQDRRGQNGRRRGSGRNFESNRNVDGFSAIPDDSSAQDLLGKPSIRGHSDQPYRGRGGGRGRGYLNRDNGEYAGRQPARRQYERQSGVSSPPAKVNGELYPLVKDVPVPHVELGSTDEQNLKENATSEGKSSNPELDNAPTYNALNKNKEGMANGKEEKKPVVKLMTLEEYQKVLERKRKDLVAKLMLKKTQEQERKVDVIKTTEERKVDVDKEFESMQQLVVRKENNEFFIKLGNDKEAGKRKEDTVGAERVKKETVGDEVKKDTDRVERVKKVFRKFEFLRPVEGGRGGRGGRGGQDWRGQDWRGGRGGQDWRGQDWRGGRGGQNWRGVQGELGVHGGGQDGRGGQGWHGGRGGQGWRGVQGGLDGQGERGGQGWRGVQGGLDGQGERGVQGGLDGQGERGGQGGGHGYSSSFSEESIKDPLQFPELGGKEVEQHSSAQGKKVEQQQQQQHSSAAQGRK